MRVFATSPDAEWLTPLADALTARASEVVVSADPRQIRSMLETGGVDAILVHTRFQTPTAAAIAGALRKMLASAPTVLVLLTDHVEAHDAAGPFDATLKWPVAPRIFGDRLVTLLRERASRGPVDSRDVRAEIEVRSLTMDEQDHYGMLGVGPGAPTDAITAAYDRLSLLFHPDRVRVYGDDELTQKASSLFARVVEAYRVLRSPADRARYDRTLRSGVGGGTASAARSDAGPARRSNLATMALVEYSRAPAVQKALRVAQQALASRDHAMALTQLRFALSLEPDNELIQQKIAELSPAG